MLGYAAIVLPVLWMNCRFSQRDDYRQWLTIFAGVFISVVAMVATYYVFIYLAWGDWAEGCPGWRIHRDFHVRVLRFE